MEQLEDALRDSLDRLVPAQQEEPEWDDIVQRLDRGPSERVLQRRRRFTPFAWLMPTTALVATAVVVLLVALSPWSGSPSVVSKAEAAIAPAAPGQVLYEQAKIMTSPGFGFRCVPNGQCEAPSVGIKVWVEGGTGTRHFHAINREVLPPGLWRNPIEIPAGPFGNMLERHVGHRIVTEVGGVLGPTHVKEALVFQPPDTLVRYTQAPTAITSDSFDPVALVRHALSTGNARVTGTTTIDHHNLRIIEMHLKGVDGYAGTATYYVDRKTSTPFQIVYHHVDSLQFPFSPVFDKTARSGITVRFSTFRRVSATPALRAQTDITKAHKGATTVCGVEFGLPDC